MANKGRVKALKRISKAQSYALDSFNFTVQSSTQTTYFLKIGALS